jgi:hypothetical protein
VSSNEFCIAFRECCISAGIKRRNLREFLDQRQGTNSVYEYIKKFNYLAQYGTHHVDIDDKKAELFRKGLSLPLQDRLVLFHGVSLNTIMSAAIEQEGTYRALLAQEEEKRKRVVSGPSEDSTRGAPPKYCLVYTPSIGKSRVPPPSPQWNHRHLRHSRCYPRHLSSLLSLYHLTHLSRRLQ